MLLDINYAMSDVKLREMAEKLLIGIKDAETLAEERGSESSGDEK